MLHRVVGEGDDNDADSGKVSLVALPSIDLYPLLTFLRSAGEVDFAENISVSQIIQLPRKLRGKFSYRYSSL